MKAVLHYENRLAPKPEGIWWLGSNENVLSYYTDSKLKRLGESRFLRLRPDADLEAYFEYLSNKMPYADTWDLVEIGDGETPQEYLKKIQGGQA